MKHSPLFLIAPAILAACSMTPGTDSNGSSSSVPSAASSSVASVADDGLPAGNFVEDEDDTRGTAYIRGYAEIRTLPEPFCETNCKTFDAVVFRVVESNSPGFNEYLSLMDQDVGSGKAVAGLGCKEGTLIRYENQVGMDMKNVTLSAELSNAILSSTAAEPIVLKLTKEPIGGGRGAPECYSHFTTVELYEADEEALMLTYLASQEGYSMQYPEGWNISQDVQIPWLSRESSATKFAAPADVAPGTSLAEAAVYAEKTSAPCPEFPDSTQETHNGYPFTKGENSDVGAGQLYETTMLTTRDGEECYTLTLYTHSCNLGADCGEGRSEPFDRGALEEIFEKMADTFRLS